MIEEFRHKFHRLALRLKTKKKIKKEKEARITIKEFRNLRIRS
jgi:hypothetical protein